MSRTDDIEDLNAWCDYREAIVPSSPTGRLAGLTLAVKDLYDVKGLPSGWGQPTRLATSGLADVTQSAVQKLLDAGAMFAGKSQCDELCFSLNGINAHYGAPVNPAAPSRITGGSSSGSAALVAGGRVDIATASDTGGSVRAPASYCGLIGLR
ncbi:MAG: amidase family protein, partial [Pseudomonadota bacterium]